MSRIAYVDGRYVDRAARCVAIEDRGFQFADGVYEVISAYGGRLLDEGLHLDRLDRSLKELRIAWPLQRRVLSLILREVLRRNAIRDGAAYIQVTRGVAARDFKFPESAKPTLVVTARRLCFDGLAQVESGVSVVTLPDIRWRRRDIKSVALLPQALAKQAAFEAGAFEAWQLDDQGCVTEGASSNAWIVSEAGELVTRPASCDILNGVTRQRLLRLAARNGIPLVERPFALDEAFAAREAFLSSSSTFVMPVVRVDGRHIGNGAPGETTRRLRAAYLAFARDGGYAAEE